MKIEVDLQENKLKLITGKDEKVNFSKSTDILSKFAHLLKEINEKEPSIDVSCLDGKSLSF